MYKFKYSYLFLTASLLFLISCQKEVATPAAEPMYFPPSNSASWATVSISDLGWKQEAVVPLQDFLEQRNTKAFMILVDGKIVMENYFGDFNQSDKWFWFSAGKTLDAFVVGVAQQEGFLNINDPTSKYLGEGWTSLDTEKELRITLKHQLTMTSGLDEQVSDESCTSKNCLFYKADAGLRWAYHTAPYTLLQTVVSKAVNTNYDFYFNEVLRDKIGMEGEWLQLDNHKLYYSTARSMARFGLLNLNRGKWNEEAILKEDYFSEMTHVSQNLNTGYGYLWWLNSNSSSPSNTTGKLIPNAPGDMFSGIGTLEQRLYIVPGRNMVIVRLGAQAYEEDTPFMFFDNELWEKINALF